MTRMIDAGAMLFVLLVIFAGVLALFRPDVAVRMMGG